MIDTFPHADALADAAAQAIAARLTEAIQARGTASLVATGGRSPGPVYDRLREADLDWSKVGITLSDDRGVDAGTPDSNVRLLRERLLFGRAAAATFYPLWPVAGLQADTIASLMPFDAVMLGMGEDGHIGSMIPGDPGLTDALLRATPALDLGLTPRERDVLRLLADGHSNESVGRELFISPDTARTQLGTAMAKLGASTRTHAVAAALRHELIS